MRAGRGAGCLQRSDGDDRAGEEVFFFFFSFEVKVEVEKRMCASAAAKRKKRKTNTLFFLFFQKKKSISTPSQQFGSNYRAIVAATRTDLGDPERPLLAFAGKSLDDEDDGTFFDDDDDELDADDGNGDGNGGGGNGGNGGSAAAAASAATAGGGGGATTTSANFHGGGGGRGGIGAGGAGSWRKERGGGNAGENSGSGTITKLEPSSTMSAMSAAALYKSKRGVSLQAAEWPAPSCADAQIVYLAFDILSIDGRCVTGRPLSERTELLRKAVVGEDEYLKDSDDEVDKEQDKRAIRRLLASDSHDIPRSCADPGRKGGLRIGRWPGNPMRGRLLAMLPDAPPLRSLGSQPPRCESAATRAEVELAARRAEENLEEGIMIKSLASQWIPGAYRNAWVKMKPEYGKVRREERC